MKHFPLQHLSIRVPWHDLGWNGSICQCPGRNTSCLKLRNISDKKDESKEDPMAGRSIKELSPSDYPPCVTERATFMADFPFEREHVHPYEKTSPDTHAHFAPTTLKYLPYAAAALPFRWMMKPVVFGDEKSTEKPLVDRYPLADVDQFHESHLEAFKAELREAGVEYDEETKKLDPWRGIYAYNRVEYRDSDGKQVSADDARSRNARLRPWQSSDCSAPAGKQSPTIHEPNHENYRFYRPLHPITKKPCPHPKSGWRFPQKPTSQDRESFENLANQQRIVWGQDETNVPRFKRFLHEVETNVSKSVFHDFTDGEKQVANLFGQSAIFASPKPTTLVRRFIQQTALPSSTILDFFAGSGTTGHAVINLNREDGGERKYILIEMGEHFDTVLVPRLKKVIYSKEWKDGKPQNRTTGISHCFKILRLESYEDTLNNLRLHRSRAQELALEAMTPEAREDYRLGYMLDLEASGSQSLLNVSAFTDPWNYTLEIASGTAGETKPTKVDLVETFNWLLGLTVLAQGHGGGVQWVEGTNPEGDKVLVLWRNTTEVDADALNDWCKKQKISVLDGEFGLIYVNGDHHLENLRREDQTWKVRLTDEEFPKLMWEGCE